VAGRVDGVHGRHPQPEVRAALQRPRLLREPPRRQFGVQVGVPVLLGEALLHNHGAALVRAQIYPLRRSHVSLARGACLSTHGFGALAEQGQIGHFLNGSFENLSFKIRVFANLLFVLASHPKRVLFILLFFNLFGMRHAWAFYFSHRGALP
jgi:hypothetical protein